MLDFPRWKTIAIWIVLLLGVVLAIPSLLPASQTAKLPSALNHRVNLGLDLAGGSHLMLEADLADVRKKRFEMIEKTIRQSMRGERGSEDDIAIGSLSRTDTGVTFMVSDPSKVDAARERLFSQTNGAGLTGQRDFDIEVRDGTRIVMTQTNAGVTRFVEDSMKAARDIIEKRINALGTREPTIILEGKDRIVVQVPGLQDPKALKDLIGKTARLEFRMVNEEPGVNPAAPPIDSEFVPYLDQAKDGPGILLRRQVLISGDQLTKAQGGFDGQSGAPVVNIGFDGPGTNTFANITQRNIGKRFAMVLDGKVLSAPTIQSAILGGQAQISGSFTTDSANALAIALKSGALPIKLAVVEERTVGPDLGKDSIRKGVIAGGLGTLAVLLFMVIVYGRFGIYANIALVLNIFMIIGIMALLNATLTLPGIAGFVLTIGAAVDANVLINERIREELKRGRKVIQAIDMGYKEASRAIFDANITNVIAAALMFAFGTGPIKGFAVVLTIGILTSVFTAVVVTRWFVSRWLQKSRPTTINI